MLTLVLVAGIQVTQNPPVSPLCETTPQYVVVLHGGQRIEAVRASYANKRITITPAKGGRIFCDGFQDR